MSDASNLRLEEAIEHHRSGRYEEARALYDSLLAEDPDNVHALGVAAILQFQSSDPEGAIAMLEKAISIAPEMASLHNNLGNIYRQLDRKDEAATFYRAALNADPRHVESLCNSAMLIINDGNMEEAREILEDALTIDPDHVETNHNLGLIHAIEGRLREAADCFERCHKEGRIPVVDLGWHAETLAALGETERAVSMLERAAAQRPDDPVIAHHLASAKGQMTGRASEAYVKQHFDSFADSFDATLNKLEYKAPEHVAAIVRQMCADYKVPLLLDLGCGTGLVGPLVRDHVEFLVGIDLSPRMLAHARRRGLYDQLIEADLIEALNALPAGKAQMAIAADTLIYFGDLSEIFAAASNALCEDGALIGTVELHDDPSAGPRILSSGRYCHSRAHVESTGSTYGLVLRHAETLQLRVEAGKPVDGLLFVLENAKKGS